MQRRRRQPPTRKLKSASLPWRARWIDKCTFVVVVVVGDSPLDLPFGQQGRTRTWWWCEGMRWEITNFNFISLHFPANRGCSNFCTSASSKGKQMRSLFYCNIGFFFQVQRLQRNEIMLRWKKNIEQDSDCNCRMQSAVLHSNTPTSSFPIFLFVFCFNYKREGIEYKWHEYIFPIIVQLMCITNFAYRIKIKIYH